MENLLIALQDLLEISYRHHVMCLEEKSFFNRQFSEILEILEPHLSSAMGLSHQQPLQTRWAEYFIPQQWFSCTPKTQAVKEELIPTQRNQK